MSRQEAWSDAFPALIQVKAIEAAQQPLEPFADL
jgi:hypothetical protein